MPYLLYKWPECWGIPSSSPSSIQAETYLRLCQVDFEFVPCTSTSKSPTGQLPAVELNLEINPRCSEGDFAAGSSIVTHLKTTMQDLDTALSPSQKAESLAFTTLIENTIVVCNIFSSWCEWKGFLETRQGVFASSVPFPLNIAIPWHIRREAFRRVGSLKPDEIYPATVRALQALSDRLRVSGGAFFFGSVPSSLDALLFAHLIYIRASPAVAPVVKDAVFSHPVLLTYIDTMTSRYFSRPAPVAAPPTAGLSWSDSAQGKSAPRASEPSAAEQDMHQKGWLWLGCAAASVAAYVLLSGRYVKISMGSFSSAQDDDGDEAEEEDEEDD